VCVGGGVTRHPLPPPPYFPANSSSSSAKTTLQQSTRSSMGLVQPSIVNRNRIDLALLDPDLEPLENVTYAFLLFRKYFYKVQTFASQILFYLGP